MLHLVIHFYLRLLHFSSTSKIAWTDSIRPFESFNLITSERAGWVTAFDMLCVMFEHGVTYVRVGCADDVFTTCNRRDQDERI